MRDRRVLYTHSGGSDGTQHCESLSRQAGAQLRTSVTGKIKGREDVDYQVRAAGGQTMIVELEAGNGAAYFNVLLTAAPVMPFSQVRWKAVLSKSTSLSTGFTPFVGI
jgi:hypothetical protein